MIKRVNFCVNLDKRDRNGRPQVTKSPGEFHYFNSDLVKLSISIIERGVETDLATSNFYLDPVYSNYIKPLEVKIT